MMITQIRVIQAKTALTTEDCTKFIENNKGILLDLLNVVLPSESINEEFTTTRDFEKRFGNATQQIPIGRS
jgi:hypothetical protein